MSKKLEPQGFTSQLATPVELPVVVAPVTTFKYTPWVVLGSAILTGPLQIIVASAFGAKAGAANAAPASVAYVASFPSRWELTFSSS